jgi:hypothetical protein
MCKIKLIHSFNILVKLYPRIFEKCYKALGRNMSPLCISEMLCYRETTTTINPPKDILSLLFVPEKCSNNKHKDIATHMAKLFIQVTQYCLHIAILS